MAEESPARRLRGKVAAPDEDAVIDAGPLRAGASSWLKVLLGLLFVMALATAVAFGARHFAVTSDRFALQFLKIEGATRFSEAQLLKLLGVKSGDNLFALDLSQAERQLAQHPWVSSVRLTRKLPATLELEITEYRAEALAAIGDSLYLITRDGTPIVPFGLGERADYPVITGVTLDEMAADRARALERLARGVKIIRHYEATPLANTYPTQELHMASDGSLELVIGQSGVTLMLGSWPIEQKLQMAARVIHKTHARGQTPSLVFLDNEAHPERVVVRLR